MPGLAGHIFVRAAGSPWCGKPVTIKKENISDIFSLAYYG
jgi:hypothetical protein